MNTELLQALTFLTWSAGAFLIVVGIFIVKLLFDISGLTVSLKKSADIVQIELSPIMKNVKETTTTVNNIVQSTNKRVAKINDVYDKASEVVVSTISKASGIAGAALKQICKGLCLGFKVLFKNN